MFSDIVQVPTYTEIFGIIWSFLKPYDWLLYIFIAFALFLLLKDIWLFYVQQKYKSKLDFQLIELKVPRAIEKGPKAMEQFFNALYSVRNAPGNIWEKWLDGEVTRWFSFEIVGDGGKMSFYIRVPGKLRSILESMLYAQYPDLEISDAQDYIDAVPDSIDKIHSIGLELWGSEVLLAKPTPYPISTYQVYEEKGGMERIIDPISVIHEIIGKLKPEEKICIQFLVKPADSSWVKEGQALIDELKAKAAPVTMPQTMSQEEGIPPIVFRPLAPGETDTLKLIGNKITKPGFQILIRYIYIAPKDDLSVDLANRGIFSYFNQYQIETLNSFKHNVNTRTLVTWKYFPHWFPKRRAKERRKKILYRYRTRFLPEESLAGRIRESGFWSWQFSKKASTSILNSEELATLYHPPTNVVLTAPTLEMIESKKVSPPSFLPY